MSALFLVVALVAAVNAARHRFVMPEGSAPGRAALGPLAAGAVITLGLAAAGVAAAEPLLEALDVAPESFEIAAGLVVVLAGGWALIFPRPREMPGLDGWGAAVVPVTFPMLLSAELIALVLTFGALEPAGTTLVAAAVGLGTAPAVGLLRRTNAVDTVLVGLARIAGLALVGVGVQLIVEGVRDV